MEGCRLQSFEVEFAALLLQEIEAGHRLIDTPAGFSIETLYNQTSLFGRDAARRIEKTPDRLDGRQGDGHSSSPSSALPMRREDDGPSRRSPRKRTQLSSIIGITKLAGLAGRGNSMLQMGVQETLPKITYQNA